MRLTRVLAATCLLSGVLLTLTSALGSSPAGATGGITYYVNSLSDTNASDCTTPTNSDCGIDDALGAYDADVTPNDADVIELPPSVSPFVVDGGVVDNSTSGVSLDIEGGGSANTQFTSSGTDGVFTLTGTAPVTFDRIAIFGGTAVNGGGVYDVGEPLTMTFDYLSGDTTTNGDGGAVFVTGTDTTFSSDIFESDVANALAPGPLGGGAIFQSGGTTTMTDDTFASDSANIAFMTTGVGGGGAFLDNVTATIDDNTFLDNALSSGVVPYAGGGALLLNGGTTGLSNDTFGYNDSTAAGGAIWALNATVTISGVTFDTNEALVGGGVDLGGGTVTLADSILQNSPCGIDTGTITSLGFNVESDDTCGFGSNDLVNNASINLATNIAPNGVFEPYTLAIGTDSSAYLEVPNADCSSSSDARGLPRPTITGENCDAGAFEVQVTSATLYVDASATSTVAGCQQPGDEACTTIGDAVSVAELYRDASVYIDVAAGNYAESVEINMANGGSLSIQGAGATSTFIDQGFSLPDVIVDGGDVTVTGVTITGGNGFLGGGVDEVAGDVTLENDTISNNEANEGAGVFDDNGALTLNDDLFSNNLALFNGGALAIDGDVATLNDDTVEDNSAVDGAGIFVIGGQTTVSNSTFTLDVASSSGGAIFNDSGALFSTNSTFADENADTSGGAISTLSGTTSVTNDTFASDASPQGGALDSGGFFLVADSLFDGATCAGSVIDNGYNVESDDSCGFGLSNVVNSPSIALATSLAANDSSGPETLAISPGSSAYEEVPLANCTVTTDERGSPRPGVAGANCDAGAYEYQVTSSSTSLTGQVIDFPVLPAITVGAQIALHATATSGLPVTYTTSTPTVCSVIGTTAQALSAGTCTIVAAQSGSATVAAARNVSQSFAITVSSLTRASAKVPGAPRIRRFVAARGRLILYVIAPLNGGSPITSYQYSLNGRRWKVDHRSSSGVMIIRTLVKGAFGVRVRARNAIGVGRPSKPTHGHPLTLTS